MNSKYPLEERTTKFSEDIIVFVKKVKPSIIITPLLSQIIRSGTSIGANYMEANNASSKKDFQNKIFIGKKEAQETKYWLHLIGKTEPIHEKDAQSLTEEVSQLIMIFQKIITTLKNDK